MKRLTMLMLVLLVAVLIGGAGYLGFRSSGGAGKLGDLLGAASLRSRQAQASAEPSTPPTVPVTQGDVQQTVTAPGQLVKTQERVLGMDVGGWLTEISVRPGDVVRKGDVLARLDKAPLEAALNEARLKLEQAETEHVRRLAEAETAVETAHLRLEQAEAEHARQLAEAELAVKRAHLRLEQAEAEHTRQLAEAKLSVERARLKLEQAELEHPRQLKEAELNLQTAESALRQARLRRPIITAADIRLQNAIEAEASAEVEYQEALDRQQANWEPPEVAEEYLRALEAARDARAIAEAEYEAAQGSQAASSEALKSLEAEIERAAIALERLEAGVDPFLELEAEKAQQALDDLAEAGVDPLLRIEVEEAQKALDDLTAAGVDSLLRIESEKAQQALDDLTKAGMDPFLELAVEKAQADLEAATLVAPFDGIVLEVKARPGETVAAGAGLVVLTNPSAVEVRTTVIEEDLPLVQIGQLAELFFDAMPEAAVQGRVARIVPQRVAGEGRPLYHVYIASEELSEGLLPGMTVDASIAVAQRRDVLRLPRALVRARSDGTAQVEVWADGQTQERVVQVGLRGDVYIEIVTGLAEGELVVGQ